MEQYTEKQQKRIQRKLSERFMKNMGAYFGEQQNKIIVDALNEPHVWIDGFGYPIAEEE